MNIKDKLDKVIKYIGEHIDDELSVQQLSNVAHLSPYHFHRLFSAHMGLSLYQYIKWLRLKRAAHQLVVERDKTILTIAMDCGFESHEAFSRAFKHYCGLSPQALRECMDLSSFRYPKYQMKFNEVSMNVEIMNKPKIRLAAVEHRGCPETMIKSLNQLIDWAKAQPIDLKPKKGEAFGIGYDDPEQTKPEDFRFDLCLKVPSNYTLSGEVKEKFLPEGRYAVAIHHGSHANLGDTVYAMYRDWLPESGEEPGDLPIIFGYQNFDYEVPESELVTECLLLLK